MNAKQNIVFMLGLLLVIMVFWVHGYWHILYQGIFTGNQKANQGPTYSKPKNGKCPPGSILVKGRCLSPPYFSPGTQVPFIMPP